MAILGEASPSSSQVTPSPALSSTASPQPNPMATTLSGTASSTPLLVGTATLLSNKPQPPLSEVLSNTSQRGTLPSASLPSAATTVATPSHHIIPSSLSDVTEALALAVSSASQADSNQTNIPRVLHDGGYDSSSSGETPSSGTDSSKSRTQQKKQRHHLLAMTDQCFDPHKAVPMHAPPPDDGKDVQRTGFQSMKDLSGLQGNQNLDAGDLASCGANNDRVVDDIKVSSKEIALAVYQPKNLTNDRTCTDQSSAERIETGSSVLQVDKGYEIVSESKFSTRQASTDRSDRGQHRPSSGEPFFRDPSESSRFQKETALHLGLKSNFEAHSEQILQHAPEKGNPIQNLLKHQRLEFDKSLATTTGRKDPGQLSISNISPPHSYGGKEMYEKHEHIQHQEQCQRLNFPLTTSAETFENRGWITSALKAEQTEMSALNAKLCARGVPLQSFVHPPSLTKGQAHLPVVSGYLPQREIRTASIYPGSKGELQMKALGTESALQGLHDAEKKDTDKVSETRRTAEQTVVQYTPQNAAVDISPQVRPVCVYLFLRM